MPGWTAGHHGKMLCVRAVTVDENAFALGGIQDTKHNGMVERMMVEQLMK